MKYGCVHGRFQPFHKGHFEYFLGAFALCDHITIGITQYDRSIADAESPNHRTNDVENPFSYWERCQIIWAVIDNAGISRNQVDIVPFPIHAPSNIWSFVPKDCVMYTTILDDWNRKKVERLRSAGFRVVVLWERKEKPYEGLQVRMALRSDPKAAEGMLPPGAFGVIRKLSSFG